jgi:transglutaminase-like putative cysteine protease
MQLQIIHETRYDYQPAVETAQHIAYLKPCQHASQQLIQHQLQIQPAPAQLREMCDVYGNSRYFFALQTLHNQLTVRAESVVTTKVSRKPSSNLPWEQQAEFFKYKAGSQFDSAAEFVFESQFVPRHQEFTAYAKPSFTSGANVLDVATDLMGRIHTDFTYDSNSTHINTPALQALQQRRGVCQDFAHIMLACLRNRGLAARYVSGYMLTEPAPGTVKLIGSDASHAWVSVYANDLPDGARWCDFDPTNNRWGWHAPGEDYITVATGRDFADVSPLRGVIHGGANHTLTVGVTVQKVDNPSIYR